MSGLRGLQLGIIFTLGHLPELRCARDDHESFATLVRASIGCSCMPIRLLRAYADEGITASISR